MTPQTPTSGRFYATALQKEEIIRLLNHSAIESAEKNKVLLSINRMDEARADEAIARLRKAIADRPNEHTGSALAAPRCLRAEGAHNRRDCTCTECRW